MSDTAEQPEIGPPRPPRPEGLTYAPEFLSPAEERELLAWVVARPFGEVRMHGVVARRKALHFGYDYAYDARSIEPTTPIPPEIAPLRDRCAALAGVEPDRLVACLVARYEPGAGIGWHRDAPMFGNTVVGVSLGAACKMRFQRGEGPAREVFAQPLAPRSAYVLAGPARASWQHSIPPVQALRYSLTFRTVRATEARPDKPTASTNHAERKPYNNPFDSPDLHR